MEIPNDNNVKVYLAPMGEKEAEKVFELASILRANGISCDFDHMGRGIKSQFKYADKIQALNVITIGDSEIERGEVNIKHMATGEQKPCKLTAEAIASLLI